MVMTEINKLRTLTSGGSYEHGIRFSESKNERELLR
jgi:hypothetical protein